MITHERKERQELQSERNSEFTADVLVGLSSPRKYLASKYFYDRAGSELFEQICRQPEYYPTRVETSILHRYSTEIVSVATQTLERHSMPVDISLVELGSGNSEKTRILLTQLLGMGNRVDYYPIDISHETLEETVGQLKAEFPGVSTTGIPMDYNSGLERVNKLISGSDFQKKKLILFLGSSIGNFEPKQAVSFLRMLRQKMSQGDNLLVGFDLQKEKGILDAAYNDTEGVTAKFNLNLLRRINSELGGHFILEKFAHRAFYNDKLGRIEMHLVSVADQDVRVDHLAKSFSFKVNETIHTENSYKYTPGMIDRMVAQSGLAVQASFTDEKDQFVLSLLKAAA